MSFNEFVENILGVNVPTSGLNYGGPVVIGNSFNSIQLPVGTTLDYSGTNDADQFMLNIDGALGSHEITQVTISSFDVASDRLQIDMDVSLGQMTLADLNGNYNVYVQENTIENNTVINFGNNLSGDVVAITIQGVTSSELVQVNVV